MLISLLPLVSALASEVVTGGGASDELGVSTPRGAQVRLAELLAESDAIHTVTSRAPAIAFTVERAGELRELVATVDARGQVISLAIDRAPDTTPQDAFGWLARELDDALAITTLAVDLDGAITAVTDDDRRYRLLPGRDSNTAVEARWAAAWDAR